MYGLLANNLHNCGKKNFEKVHNYIIYEDNIM